uniref:Uncharacterized protein n=1 Tax=Los Azufres archaeal virus 2 TaxID=1425359 RepID=A0A0A0P541_9VIRU|nr:hypothetical protein [Los Azufres archaeal virus 2]
MYSSRTSAFASEIPHAVLRSLIGSFGSFAQISFMPSIEYPTPRVTTFSPWVGIMISASYRSWWRGQGLHKSA